MYKLRIIKHAEITLQDLNEIIRVKSIAWPYTYDQQVEWMNKNVKENDFHVLLYGKKEIVAYLNLITTELDIDGLNYNAFGIGNVCAIKKGQGFGIELMKQTNQFIIQEGKIGLLFCKPFLVDFYLKCGWTTIKKRKLKLSFDIIDIETLIFNFKFPFTKLTYNKQAF
jgi:hypothetical protein